MTRRLLAGSTFLLAAALQTAAGAPQCPDWATDHYLAGVSDDVKAFALYDDGAGSALYVAGCFERAGGVPASRIARWDGTTWSALGAGLERQNTNVLTCVEALIVYDDGSGPALYAGGEFDLAGGNPAPGIARWDGVAWSDVGGGVNGDVESFAVHDDGSGPALYVGGGFNVAGGQPIRGIARWDGSSWSSLGNGLLGSPYDLVTYGPHLYAGGNLSSPVNPLAFQHLARWDGTSWTRPGTVDPNPVHSLAVFDDGTGAGPLLYVGTSSVTYGTPAVTANGVASFDGAQWGQVGNGPGGRAEDLVVFDKGNGPALYATGSWGAASEGREAVKRWTGSNWKLIGTIDDSLAFSRAYSLGVFDDGGGGGPRLFLGGSFTSVFPQSAGNVASWRTSGWESLEPQGGLSDLVRAFEVFEDGAGPVLYAGGEFTETLARWEDTGWEPVAGGQPSGDVLALKSFDDGSGPGLFVGGTFGVPIAGTVNGLVRWTGSAWSDVGGGITGGAKTVKALEVFDDGSGPALYAGGEFDQVGGTLKVNNIARWDGMQWSQVGAGLAGGTEGVRAFAVWDDGGGARLYAGGDFLTAGGVPAKRLATWDGSAWSEVPGVGGGGVFALASFDDETGDALYAGGAGNYGGHFFLGRWNGSWSAVGDGLDSFVYALKVYDDGHGDELYATGRFLNTQANQGLRRAARWDGVAWERLGTGGLDDRGHALAVHPVTPGRWPSLWIGGKASLADKKPSFRVARWTNDCACQGVAYCTAGVSTAGCTATLGAVGDAARSATSGFDVSAAGVSGGQSGILYFGTNGAQASPWGNGTSLQCVVPPLQRTGAMTGNGTPGLCDGAFQLDFNNWMSAHPQKAPAAGDAAYLQLWYRDPLSTTNRASALSDALRFSVCP